MDSGRPGMAREAEQIVPWHLTESADSPSSALFAAAAPGEMPCWSSPTHRPSLETRQRAKPYGQRYGM